MDELKQACSKVTKENEEIIEEIRALRKSMDALDLRMRGME